MGDPFAVDLDAVGASKIDEPKLTVLLMDHGMTPGDFWRFQNNRIALGAAKGAKAADRNALIALGFQPSHHLHFKSHILSLQLSGLQNNNQ